VLVGVGKYHPDTIGRRDLSSPKMDVEIMQEIISYLGFKSEDTEILLDDAANREKILGAVHDRLLTLSEGSRALFYFSGHGSKLKGTGSFGEWDNETIVPYDGRLPGEPARDIIDDEIYDWLREINRRGARAIFIFDSCYSGGAARPGTEIKGMPPVNHTVGATASQGIHPLRDDVFAGSSALVVMTGSAASELSSGQLVDQEWRSVFTGALRDVLLPDNGTPPKTWRGVHAAVVARLKSGAGEIPLQSPQLFGAKDAPVFGGDTPYSYAIGAVRNSEVEAKLNAGSDLGITVNSIFKLFGPDQVPWHSSESFEAAARVVKVDRRSAELQVVDQKRLISSALAAVEYSYAMPQIRLKLTVPKSVKLDPLDEAAVRDGLKGFAGDGGDTMDLVLKTAPQQLVLETPDGRILGGPIELKDSDFIREAVRRRVTEFARWTRFDTWRRSSVVPNGLSFRLAFGSNTTSAALEATQLKDAIIPAGARLLLSVENNSLRRTRVDALLLRQDFTIDVCPIGIIDRNARGSTEEVTLPASTGLAGWKLIISDPAQIVDLDFLRSDTSSRAPRTSIEDEFSKIWNGSSGAASRAGSSNDAFWQTVDIPFKVVQSHESIAATATSEKGRKRCLGIPEKN
jgi:hypothetical protein